MAGEIKKFDVSKKVPDATFTRTELIHKNVLPMEQLQDEACKTRVLWEQGLPLGAEMVEQAKELIPLTRELLRNSLDLPTREDNETFTSRIEASNAELAAALRENTAAILNGR